MIPTLAVLALVLAAGMPAAAADGSSAERVVCQRIGHVTLTPGLTLTKQDFRGIEKGSLQSCSGPGAEGLSAELNATLGGNGSCGGAHIDGPGFVVKWSDGTTSVGNATAEAVPPFAFVDGAITAGKFAGRTVRSLPVITTSEPQNCATEGLREIDYFGQLIFE